MVKCMGIDRLYEIIGKNEREICKCLSRGTYISIVEETIKEIIEVEVHVCCENNVFFSIVDDCFIAYIINCKDKVAFIDEIQRNALLLNHMGLEFGTLYTFQCNEYIYCRINVPRVLLVNLHLIEQYPSYRFALGIADIAGMLRKNNYAYVDIVDMQFSSMDIVKEYISSTNYDFIGFSVNFGQADILRELIEYTRLVSPNSQIVLGNYLAACKYESIINEYPYVLICNSEGELFWEKLCLNYSRSIDNDYMTQIPNMYYFSNGNINFSFAV